MIAFREGARPCAGLYDEIVVDCFAGGGGASTGIEEALGRAVDVAVNHDPEAVAMHRINHPHTLHYCEDVFAVDPVAATAGRPVGLAWFSPDCKHFSKAKGGRPVSKRVRGLAWVVVRWARAVRPRVIMLENVEEFQTWGPLGPDSRPCPRRKGRTFRRWVRSLKDLGYAVEWRELRACDYGAPTIRKRLFLVARCDGRPITWPERTHGHDEVRASGGGSGSHPRRAPRCDGQARTDAECASRLRGDLGGTRRALGRDQEEERASEQGGYEARTSPGRRNGATGDSGLGSRPRALKPWRTAAECIDWSIPCPSIFERARPLKPATLRRIAAGVMRFVVNAAAPFMVNMAHGGSVEPVHAPATTIKTEKGGCRAVVVPTLVETGYGERRGQRPRVPGLHRPLGTVVAGGGKHALVAAFLAQHNTGMVGHRATKPLSTITGKGCHQQVVAATLVKQNFGAKPCHGADEPLHTVTTQSNRFGLVSAFLTAYYGNEKDGQRCDEPARTATTKERLALVTVHVAGRTYAIEDLGMRMLTPRELYRCQGFPEGYVIDRTEEGPLTKTAQVRMVGNSVCPPVAAALVRANLGEGAVTR